MRALLIVLAILIGIFDFTARAQSGNDLFQKALSKERVEGELVEAIALYARVVSEFSSDRVLAAKALVQMGRCYERLGRRDAQTAYERVVREYGEQTAAVTEARERLAALMRAVPSTLPPPAPAPRSTSPRQLGRADLGASITADGRYLSSVSWGPSDMHVRELGTGRRRGFNLRGPSADYAVAPVISPDGQQIAYAWFTKDGFDSLRVTPAVFGATARTLVGDRELSHVVPHAWSPDRRHIFAVFSRANRTHQIVRVAAADGSTQIVKSLQWREPKKLSLSPDGRWIAYDAAPREDSRARDIYVVAVDGQREGQLVENPANDESPLWTADSRHVVFTSDRGGRVGLWAVPVENGVATREPGSLRGNVGAMTPIGLTQSGALYYGVTSRNIDVYLVELRPQTGTLGLAHLDATQSVGPNSAPVFSPFDDALAFVSQREPDANLTGDRVLIVKPFVTQEERVFDLPNQVGFELQWSPDGQSLMATGRDEKGIDGVHRVDVRTGHTSLLAAGVTTCSTGCSPKGWFPDGQSIYFVKSVATGTGVPVQQLVRRHLSTAIDEEIIRYDASDPYSYLTLSPDGNWFAGWLQDSKARRTTLTVLRADGREPRALVQVSGDRPAELSAIAWSADSRHVFYSQKSGPHSHLWRVSIDGVETKALGLLLGRVVHLAVNRTGTRIAYATHEQKTNVWVMENFLGWAAPGSR